MGRKCIFLSGLATSVSQCGEMLNLQTTAAHGRGYHWEIQLSSQDEPQDIAHPARLCLKEPGKAFVIIVASAGRERVGRNKALPQIVAPSVCPIRALPIMGTTPVGRTIGRRVPLRPTAVRLTQGRVAVSARWIPAVANRVDEITDPNARYQKQLFLIVFAFAYGFEHAKRSCFVFHPHAVSISSGHFRAHRLHREVVDPSP
jgi:hypothetical protein